MRVLKDFFQRLRTLPIQSYINATLVGIGLAADLVSLGLFFGAINSPTTGSNFYVNSQEFLSWVLFAIIYSVGLGNAIIRRRWRRRFGYNRSTNSIFNFIFNPVFVFFATNGSGLEYAKTRWTNFKRDFSLLFLFMFPAVFLFTRALTATVTATSATGSPWGDWLLAFGNTLWVTPILMILTSAFDFAMSMFQGDGLPTDLIHHLRERSVEETRSVLKTLEAASGESAAYTVKGNTPDIIDLALQVLIEKRNSAEENDISS